MGILDDFQKDCQENEYGTSYASALQAEVDKQLKAIADYDANPELLDSQIKFNPEEFDYNEKKISKQLYIEEDNQYPEADDPEELLKTTLSGKRYEDFVEDKETIPPQVELTEF